MKTETKLYRYALPGGWTILAGKTDADNDTLSLDIARPGDYWFHVKGMPGSHVILRPEGDETPDKALLKTAAAVAAWHSKARTGGQTAVSCVRAKYVRKSKRDKPGAVHIRKARVLMVKPALPKFEECR